MRSSSRYCILLTFLAVSLLSGCGYGLRGDQRPFFENNHIRSLYVEPVKNNSYKAGVETLVYNALRKKIAEGGYVRIVDKEGMADATFSSTVTDASYAPAAIVQGSQIPTGDPNNPTRPELSQLLVAKSYGVNLRVKFKLTQRHPEKLLWGDEIARTETFPATVYLGALGNTNALINESDYERALSELSVTVVTDAQESINTIF